MHYAEIFEEELVAWMQDEKTWPPNRDYRMFREWFDVRIVEIMFDLADGPVTHEDL